MLSTITTPEIYAFLLVFFRMGAGIMVLPGIGEGYVSPRIRLLFALSVSMVVYMVVRDVLPAMPTSVPGLLILILGELTVGIFIGLLARILISVMHMVGTIIAYQVGLSSATLFDPNAGTQGSAIGSFLTVTSMVVLFASNVHHILLLGLLDSYSLFPPGHPLPIGDMANMMTKVIGSSFEVAVKISAPHIIVGLVVYMGAGIMARLMPNMQIFFVLMPFQIAVGIFILMITFSASTLWYIEHTKETMGLFLKTP